MAAAGLRHLPVAAALVVVLGVASGAQARHHHHHHHNHPQDLDGGDRDPQPREADGPSNVTAPAPEAGGIAAAIEGMIRACTDDAAALKDMPIARVVETVGPTGNQLATLEQIRSAAADAANKLNASCPKDVPAGLPDRLNAMRVSLDAIKAALLRLRPAFVSAYAVLSDEQKAQLVARAIYQRPRPAADPAAHNQPHFVALDCGRRHAMLVESWPLNQIEGKLALSDAQHVALYELMAAVYRAGSAAACHEQSALTPVSRVDQEVGRVEALRQWVDAIASALTSFVNALNDGQNAQLNVIFEMSPQSQPETTAR